MLDDAGMRLSAQQSRACLGERLEKTRLLSRQPLITGHVYYLIISDHLRNLYDHAQCARISLLYVRNALCSSLKDQLCVQSVLPFNAPLNVSTVMSRKAIDHLVLPLLAPVQLGSILPTACCRNARIR